MTAAVWCHDPSHDDAVIGRPRPARAQPRQPARPRHLHVVADVPTDRDAYVHPAPTGVTYRRRRLVALLAVGMVAALLILAAGRSVAALRDVPASVPERRPAPASYVVQPGDTLWSIARRILPSGDPRPLVDELARLNGGDDLAVGQRLVIP
jgi:nucleoid-associated protein YgaU